jgi:signal transduction histidine kinase/CheY-like chemotaxis protein/HPt (histidine-containing phosphotransfer) domain-containing protein
MSHSVATYRHMKACRLIAAVILVWCLLGMWVSAFAADAQVTAQAATSQTAAKATTTAPVQPSYVKLIPPQGSQIKAGASAVYFRQEEDHPLSIDRVWSMYQMRTSRDHVLSDSGYAHVGWGGGTIWIVLPVYNQTDINDWKLDLSADTFFAHPRFTAMEILQAETGLRIPVRMTSSGETVIGLPKRLSATLVIKADVAPGWPVVLKPAFSPAGDSVKIIHQPGHIAWMLAAIIALYLFASSAIPWRSLPALIALGGVFEAVFIGGMFWQSSANPVFGAALCVIGAGLSYMAASFILLRRQRFSIRYKRAIIKDMMMPGTGLAFIAAGLPLLYILPQFSLPILMMMLGGPVVVSLLMLWRCYADYDTPTLWPVMALMLGLIGLIATLPLLVDLDLPVPSLMMVAPIAVLLQNLMFLSWAVANRLEEAPLPAAAENVSTPKKTAKQSEIANKLKASQESYDHERMLRVLEQERIQMEVLRDSERRKTEEMRLAKDAADEAIRAKSAFFAVLGHEIRTPMNGILGMVKLLLKSNISKDQRNWAGTILESGEAMMTILNDMLDFEKIESGKMSFESVPFDLPHMMGSITTLMQGHAMGKGLQLNLNIADEVPQVVVSDPTRLRQVILNLISNAIKFTERGSVTIWVKSLSARVFDEGKERYIHQLYFGVQDTGLGIPRDSQKNLFTPFMQADASTSRKFGGTGLGLAICQKLVERMGGEINVSSKEGEGSTFFFSVPMQEAKPEELKDVVRHVGPAPTAADEKEQAAAMDRGLASVAASLDEDAAPSVIAAAAVIPPSSAGQAPIGQAAVGQTMAPQAEAVPAQSVLVIDDNQINHRVVEGFLSSGGHRLTFVDSVASAWEALSAANAAFDLVLMDLELPDGNGADLTMRMRLEGGDFGAKVPVIGLTGHTDDDILRHCFDSGMHDVLIKPVDPDALQAIMGRVANKVYGRATVRRKQATEDVIATAAQAQPANAPVADAGLPDGIVLPGQRITKDYDDEFGDSFQEAIEIMAQQKDSSETEDGMPSNVILFDPATLMPLKDTLGTDAVKSLLEDLYMTSESTIKAMQDALASNDWEQIRARAHDLKGMSGNFGLKDLSTRAAHIDQSLRQGQTGGIAEKVQELPQAFVSSREELARWLAA